MEGRIDESHAETLSSTGDPGGHFCHSYRPRRITGLSVFPSSSFVRAIPSNSKRTRLYRTGKKANGCEVERRGRIAARHLPAIMRAYDTAPARYLQRIGGLGTAAAYFRAKAWRGRATGVVSRMTLVRVRGKLLDGTREPGWRLDQTELTKHFRAAQYYLALTPRIRFLGAGTRYYPRAGNLPPSTPSIRPNCPPNTDFLETATKPSSAWHYVESHECGKLTRPYP